MEQIKPKDILKKAREEKRITQAEMADRIANGMKQGYSLRQYQRLEDGQFPKYKMNAIIQVDQILGTHLAAIIYDKTTPFPHDQLPMIRSIRGEEVDNVDMFVRHERVQHGRWTRITGRPLRASNGDLLGGVTVCRDITEVKEEELFREGQSQVLEMIAADKPLGAVLESLVLLMEGQAEGLRCSILLLGRDGKHVQHGAAPHLPETYVKAVNGAPIGPRNGSCCRQVFGNVQFVRAGHYDNHGNFLSAQSGRVGVFVVIDIHRFNPFK